LPIDFVFQRISAFHAAFETDHRFRIAGTRLVIGIETFSMPITMRRPALVTAIPHDWTDANSGAGVRPPGYNIQAGQTKGEIRRWSMTEREINTNLWWAFLLGARVVGIQNGKDLSLTYIGDLGRLARELAESDRTLEDPTALAAKEPAIGSLLQRLGTLTIRNNRDLAKRIVEGYSTANEEDE
jgi:hypothetical protein